MTTIDLSKFGYRELDMAGDLLKAIKDGLPDDFYDVGITVMMNQNSGNVFLTNDDLQVAMLNDEGKLESWYWTPYEGIEGFFDDLLDEYENMNDEDKEYMQDLAENKGIKIPVSKGA